MRFGARAQGIVRTLQVVPEILTSHIYRAST